MGRTIAVLNLDKRWGKLDTSRCVSVRGYMERSIYEHFLHKSTNKRWYVEVFNEKNGFSRANEVTLDMAMDWLDDHLYAIDFSELRCLEDLPDVAETPTPAHGGGIVLTCVKCRQLSRRVKESRSTTERAIIAVLKKRKGVLSGPEISDAASVKYNSNFRSILARLVSRSIVVKVWGKGGYRLSDHYLS
jgi:hypothetical protein